MGNTSFDETALRITPSPPPSHGSNSASSAIESKYLTRVRVLHYLRLTICIVLIGLSAAVIGCEGHALHVYKSTHLSSEWWLPLWPQHFDLRPTVTLLVGAAVVLLSSLSYSVVAIIPSPHSRTTILNTAYTALTFISLLGSLVSLAYTTHVHHVDSHSPSFPRDTLHSWTCRWAPGVSASDVAAAAHTSPVGGTDNGGISPPSGFGRLCHETNAAWAMVLASVVIEGLALIGAAGLGWWLGFGVGRERVSFAGARKGEKAEVDWVMQEQGHGMVTEVDRS